MRDLATACTELADQLKVFTDADVTSDRADGGLATVGLLVVDHDADAGTPGRAVPATRTPGNTQAINAEMDAHELVRRLEASLRLVVTGHTGRMRGGSDSSTRAAIAAIEKLGEAISPAARQLAARLLDRATTTIGQLPAVDEIPRWEKIRPGPGGLPPTCPNCQTYSLRVALASGVVVCVFPGCEDLDGRRPPQARMDISKIDGRPVLVWRDGLVQLLTPGVAFGADVNNIAVHGAGPSGFLAARRALRHLHTAPTVCCRRRTSLNPYLLLSAGAPVDHDLTDAFYLDPFMPVHYPSCLIPSPRITRHTQSFFGEPFPSG